jgi:hypothetical protein
MLRSWRASWSIASKLGGREGLSIFYFDFKSIYSFIQFIPFSYAPLNTECKATTSCSHTEGAREERRDGGREETREGGREDAQNHIQKEEG